MISVLDKINADIEKIKILITNFLLNHSSIFYSPVNSPDSAVFILGRSDYHWGSLRQEGKQLQAMLFKAYNNFLEIAEVLISDLPSDSRDEFKESSKEVLLYIEQNDDIREPSIETIINRAISRLDNQMSIMTTLYDSKSGSFIFIPDTNALLTNPNIEKWEFPSVTNFEILILPTVASELDKLKIYHTNQELREKAQSIIKRFKEYRRRGKITEGVTLVKNKITFRAIAVEPDFEKALSWLDRYNNDDRIIASLIHVMKNHPNSSVILVTSDFNLQNKVEFARLSFVETPGE